MTSLPAIVIGGLAGAMVGLLWRDPYRNTTGQFTTRQNGYKSWLFQTIAGGFLGAAITSVALPVVLQNPIVSSILIILMTYGVYVTKVDPR